MATQVDYAGFLSVSDGRVLWKVEDVFKTVEALVGEGVTHLTLAYLGRKLQAHLHATYPWCADPVIAASITFALRQYQERIKREKDDGYFVRYMINQYVKPFCPLAEDDFEIEVEPVDEKTLAEWLAGYPAFLQETLAGKEVIVVTR